MRLYWRWKHWHYFAHNRDRIAHQLAGADMHKKRIAAEGYLSLCEGDDIEVIDFKHSPPHA